VLAAYLLLTCILSYPLITHLTTHVPGSDLWAFDEYTFVWDIWWFKHALLVLQQSPLTNNYIFYPIGINLALFTLTVFNGALAMPLLPWLPLPLASNVITLFADTPRALAVSADGATVYAARDEADYVAVTPGAIPVTTPTGLFRTMVTATVLAGMRWPSTHTRSIAGCTTVPSSLTSPLTVTLPAAISASALRREHSPQLARYWLSRITRC